MERKKGLSKRMWLAILFAVLCLLFLFSFILGRLGVPLTETVRILLSPIFDLEKTWTDAMAAAVLRIRLPRILLACLVG